MPLKRLHSFDKDLRNPSTYFLAHQKHESILRLPQVLVKKLLIVAERWIQHVILQH